MENRIFRADFIASPFGKQENFADRKSAPVFIKEFELPAQPIRAELAVATLGNGYIEINGKQIDAVLVTPQSNYLKTIFYDEIEVSPYLKQGKNVLLFELGNGFYNDFVVSVWDFYKALWRDVPKMIAELDVLMENGETIHVKSDGSFRVAEGGVLFNSIRNGETHDMGRHISANNYRERLPEFRDAVICTNVTAKLVKSPMPYLVEAEQLSPTSVEKTDTGSYLVTFERNFAGYVGLHVENAEGTEITLRYGELVTDGHLDQSNINIFIKEGDCQTDRLICSGGKDFFKPRHTYSGFRYVEIEGLPKAPDQGDIIGYVVHQNIARSSSFSCGNELLNRIYDCAINASYSNMVQVITDCPTREKLGWAGDLQISAEQFLTDFEIAPMFEKIERDLADAQNYKGQLPGIAPTSSWGFTWGNGPSFDAALFELPYQVYRYTGSTALFDKYFENMDWYLGYLQTCRNAEGLLGIGMGDWSAPSELQNGGETPTEATDTLYFMYFLDLMRKACRWRNRDDRRYRELYDELKELFDKKYLTPDGYSVCNHESLLAFLIDLGFHGEKELNNFAKQLSARVKEKGYFHECGIIGMRHLFHSLVKIGDFEAAYRILNQTEQPSYGSWIKAGNTTLAESWNDNMSKNHHMFSDVASFFIKSIAGIAYSYEGGLWVTVAPNGFGQMDFAKAEQKAPFGKLSSEWRKERGRIRLVLHIPENTPYRLIVPKGYRCDSEQRKADKIEFCFVKSGNESAE